MSSGIFFDFIDDKTLKIEEIDGKITNEIEKIRRRFVYL
jgi:hypothetical protein